jgi:iron complex transport system ATP-binding protein
MIWKSNSQPFLKVEGIYYSSILNGISFEMSQGEVVSLVGPNGSGKSTLLKTVSGILSLDSKNKTGQVRFEGQDLLSLPSGQRAQRVVYLGSEYQSEFPVSAYEAVSLGRLCQSQSFAYWVTESDRSIVESSMQKCFCWHLRDRYLDTLSSGERQLVALARALAQGAQLFLLDESLSKMDLNHQAGVGRLILELTKLGHSFLIVSHDLNLTSEWATRTILMKKGHKVFDGVTREALSIKNLQILYPGSNFVIGQNPVTRAPKVFLKE